MVTKGQSFSRHNLEVKLVTKLHIVVRYSSVCVSHILTQQPFRDLIFRVCFKAATASLFSEFVFLCSVVSFTTSFHSCGTASTTLYG